MMNKRIRTMVDDIFAQMMMTAENLALRDELMANAQARFEDALAQGRTEEEALSEVAASLSDVHDLLREMNGGEEAAAQEPEQTPAPEEEPAPEAEAASETEAAQTAEETVSFELDLSETLNKAFSALGSFGKSIMPQAKKFVKDVDEATGGALGNMGKAVNKGVKDAQKAAGDAIDKMSDMTGELVFDFGKREEAGKRAGRSPEDLGDEASDLRDEASDLRDEASDLRDEAADLRAEAGLKAVTGDQAGAGELRAKADELDLKADALCAQAIALDTKADMLETQADALEQAQAMEDAQKAAAQEAAAAQGAPVLEENAEPLMDEDGDVNEDVFARVVEQIERDANEATQAGPAQDADYTVAGEATASGSLLFPAAGLRTVDIELDADDVKLEACEGGMVETLWSAHGVEGEPYICMEGHTLKIRRKNPDVFKTFFSVFAKNGGEITVRVPRGYAADYKISTTSGDIRLGEIDVDSVKVSSTSGSIRLEPDAAVRAGTVKADTVSGAVTVSACAQEVGVNSVSGSLFISCDAQKVNAASVSGGIHIEGACDTWDVDSVSGAVELICTAVPEKKIHVDTVSASAKVALPGSIRGFAAEVTGMNAKLVNEFGFNRYGTCALPIRMNSMSGTLKITKL